MNYQNSFHLTLIRTQISLLKWIKSLNFEYKKIRPISTIQKKTKYCIWHRFWNFFKPVPLLKQLFFKKSKNQFFANIFVFVFNYKMFTISLYNNSVTFKYIFYTITPRNKRIISKIKKIEKMLNSRTLLRILANKQ